MIKIRKIASIGLVGLLICPFAIAKTEVIDILYKGQRYYPTPQVCFTPGGDCTNEIIGAINRAKNTILVQAYSFTSITIESALAQAKARNVDVKVILDKSQLKQRSSLLKLLKSNGIPLWIDNKVAIAHNKVMIIDDNTVITGSFNFTHAAQYKNAENVLIINNKQLAGAYTDNWVNREKKSYKFPN